LACWLVGLSAFLRIRLCDESDEGEGKMVQGNVELIRYCHYSFGSACESQHRKPARKPLEESPSGQAAKPPG
jgi:hypothetical protein